MTSARRPSASVIAAALRAGVSWFDTAEAYGNGASEKSLAAALSSLGVAPGSVGIATKWWPLFRGAASIEATIDARSAALSPYPIDLHQVRSTSRCITQYGAATGRRPSEISRRSPS